MLGIQPGGAAQRADRRRGLTDGRRAGRRRGRHGGRDVGETRGPISLCRLFHHVVSSRRPFGRRDMRCAICRCRRRRISYALVVVAPLASSRTTSDEVVLPGLGDEASAFRARCRPATTAGEGQRRGRRHRGRWMLGSDILRTAPGTMTGGGHHSRVGKKSDQAGLSGETARPPGCSGRPLSGSTPLSRQGLRSLHPAGRRSCPSTAPGHLGGGCGVRTVLAALGKRRRSGAARSSRPGWWASSSPGHRPVRRHRRMTPSRDDARTTPGSRRGSSTRTATGADARRRLGVRPGPALQRQFLTVLDACIERLPGQQGRIF